jgi:methyl-accepting chemotaxis protein
MSAGTEEVTASLDNMSKIARDTASGMQNVAAASEEQLASLERISSSTYQLNAMAEQLKQAIRTFKI